MVSPTIESVTAAIDRRIEELHPSVKEYEVLMQFRTTIREQLASNAEPERKQLAARLHKATSSNGNGTPSIKPSMTDKVLQAVRHHEDGVAVDEIAKEVRTATSYVYRIAKKLEGDGLVIRRNKKLVAA